MINKKLHLIYLNIRLAIIKIYNYIDLFRSQNESKFLTFKIVFLYIYFEKSLRWSRFWISYKINLHGKSRCVRLAESIKSIPKSFQPILLSDLEPLTQDSKLCKLLTHKVTRDVVQIKLSVGLKINWKLFNGSW
jgi:transposase